MVLRQDKGVGLAIGVTILLSAILQSWAYWPGIMIYDAIRQYDQALNGQFDDWHPPSFEWLWRQFLVFHSGPATMLLLQILLYWAGFALLSSWALAERRRGLALAVLACALFPISFALMGAVLKDSLMAGALLTVAGLLAWHERRGGDWPWVMAAALLVCAMTVRFNAFLAGTPLLVGFLPIAQRQTRLRLATVAVLTALPLAAAMPVANRLLHAKRSDVELSLIIYDLGGITEYSGVDAFPALPIADKVAVNHRCYSSVKWDRYAWWDDDPCPIGFDNIRTAFKKSGQSPTLFWAKAVIAHPLAYAEHRIGHFNTNVRLFVRGEIERPVPNQSDPNEWRFQVAPNPVNAAVDRAALWSADTPFGWPVFWLAIALGVLVTQPKRASSKVVAPIALSALLYGTGYLLVSVASEMRYHLWTMVGAMIAATIAIADIVADNSSSRWTALWMFAPAGCVTLAGLAWRLM